MMESTGQKDDANIFYSHSVWERRKFRRALKRRMSLGADFPETLQNIMDVIVVGTNGELMRMGALSPALVDLLRKEKCGDQGKTSEGFMFLFTQFCQEILACANQDPEKFSAFSDLKEAGKNPLSTKKKSADLFTPRENTVLKAMKKGMSNKEIATVLEISLYTVKDHIKHIMNKMEIHTRSGIVGKLAHN